MLRWRLFLGSLIIGALIGLCWLDHAAPVPGMVLLPLLVALVLLGTREIMHFAAVGGMRPLGGIVYAGNVLVVASAWAGPVCWRFAHAASGASGPSRFAACQAGAEWTMLALCLAVVLVLVAEMGRFRKPGGATANIAAAVFAVVYLGFLLSFLVRLRMVWGVAALAVLLIAVKLGDTGAYAVGRLVGRHKMAPRLSPGKTIEGALGAVAFSCAGAWVAFCWLNPGLAWWRSVLFGLLVGLSGMVGDLAESLLKRDVRQKDSSSWLPGFGGVLDLLDSIVIAGPVAYACWTTGLVG
jgi:phosphatidate cytidylyltransferase